MRAVKMKVMKQCPKCGKRYIEKREKRPAKGRKWDLFVHTIKNAGTMRQSAFGCVVKLCLIVALLLGITAPDVSAEETKNEKLVKKLESKLVQPRCRLRGGFQTERYIWDNKRIGTYKRDGKVDARMSYDCTVVHVVRDVDLLWLRLITKEILGPDYAVERFDMKVESGLMLGTLLDSKMFGSEDESDSSVEPDRYVFGIDVGITLWDDFAIGISPHYVIGENVKDLNAWGTTFFISGNLSALID